MVEKLAERFAYSPHRWLIVTAVTLVIALATSLPQVDQLFAERSERAELEAQLAHAVKTAARLPEYERRMSEEQQKLQELRKRQVDEAGVTDLRSWLVNAARNAGCQIRKIDLASATRRPWLADDHPLDTPTKQDSKGKGLTPFVLETRSVSFSVTGTASEVFALLKAIDADQRLLHTHSVELRPVARNTDDLQLDLSLKYFALVRPATAA